MKVRKHWIEWTMLGVLGGLVVLSLVVPQLLREREAPRLLSVSVLFREPDASGWSAARQGMEQAADELGAELRFLTLAAQGSGEEQAEQLRREAEGGADALVVLPADGEALSAPCPAVTLEIPVQGCAGAAAPDNRAVGQALAQTLLEDWNGGQVALLEAEGSPEADLRLEAAQEALTQAGVPWVRQRDVPRGQVRWVMAFEPLSTRLSAEQKETEGLGWALYGVGSSTAIAARLERGTIAAVAAWSDYAAGYLAVEQAVRAAQGEVRSLEPLPFSIVRGEDIYAPENQKLLFPVTS